MIKAKTVQISLIIINIYYNTQHCRNVKAKMHIFLRHC